MSMNKPLKIVIVTDSAGNPRSFPASEIVELEQTYPYLLRKYFPNAVVWQLSYGGTQIVKLLNQPMGYLTHWEPDIIIVQAGLNDCQPIVFTDFQQEIFKRLTGPFYKWIRKYIHDPRLIKFRQGYRVSKSSFRKTLRQFKMVFPKSKIYWMEICAGEATEKSCPGWEQRMGEYNHILEEIFKKDLIRIKTALQEVSGFNSQDHMHLNKRGHDVMASILIKTIESSK